MFENCGLTIYIVARQMCLSVSKVFRFHHFSYGTPFLHKEGQRKSLKILYFLILVLRMSQCISLPQISLQKSAEPTAIHLTSVDLGLMFVIKRKAFLDPQKITSQAKFLNFLMLTAMFFLVTPGARTQ